MPSIDTASVLFTGFVAGLFAILGFLLRNTLNQLQTAIDKLNLVCEAIIEKLASQSERLVKVETRCRIEHGE